MNINQVKQYVSTQLKNYRVMAILDKFSDDEWKAMHMQITRTKPWESERRLIDFAIQELDTFRYNLYCERHYEDLLIDKACIECLKYEDLTLKERKYYVRKPNNRVVYTEE
jgi:hypothetical protein